MQKKRKKHIDSTAEIVKIYAAAGNEIQWPEGMRQLPGDLSAFKKIIEEAANIEWTPHKIQLAAIMARMINDVDYEHDLLRREGTIITNEDNGTRYPNPRKNVVTSYQTTIISMRRSLGIHTRALTGDNREAAKRRNIALEAQNKAKGNISDLIPGRG